MSNWMSDRSRYETGFECPMKRLLQYHLDGTGYVPVTERAETAVGSAIHRGLELLLFERRVLTRTDVEALLSSDGAVGTNWMSPSDEIAGVLHGYVRTVLPWLLANYEIISLEEEFDIPVGNDIVWMTRPDLILRSLKTGKYSVVDFKSTRAKAERIANIHSISLQSIMNAYAVSMKYGNGEPCESIQTHVIQLGTDTWPTPITHAYYRPANAPYVPEDWQPRARRPDGTWLGKLYRRVTVGDHRSVPEWVWQMPMRVLLDLFPLQISDVDPIIHGKQVVQALSSIRLHEGWWRTAVGSIDWSTTTFDDLSHIVPRTFHCIPYTDPCPYTSTCFDPTTTTLEANPNFVPRNPHHPQER